MNRLLKLVKILAVPRFAMALTRGCAATVEHEPILRNSAFRFIADIGANCGQFAMAAREYVPSAVIHSVEPLSEPAAILEQLMFGDNSFFLHRCAVGARRGSARIHVFAQNYSSSLLPSKPRMHDAFPGIVQRGARDVPVVQLGDLMEAQMILAPALLKIDVQGYELEVLRGCGDLLWSFSSILVECAFVEMYDGQPPAQAVLRYLTDAGFQLAGIYDPYYDRRGMPIQADFLFERRAGRT